MANHKKNAGWRRPVKEENVQIGERCRKAREAAGYTHEKLAETIGRGRSLYRIWNAGNAGCRFPLSGAFALSCPYQQITCCSAGQAEALCRFPLTNGSAGFQNRRG